MNFDKFKSVRPSVKSTKNVLDKISDKDEKYIEKLAKIQYKKSNSRKIIQIVSTTAAAVMLVTAFSLWALLGRGIRGTYNPPAGSPSSMGSVYNATFQVVGEYILEGLDQYQKFFDDYVNGRACTLVATYIDTNNNNELIHKITFICDVDGSVTLKNKLYRDYSGENKTSVPDRKYDSMKFIMDRQSNLYLLEFNDYENPLPGWRIALGVDKLQNKYENSQRVFDTDNTEPVTIQDGNVISGEKTLAYFFRNIINHSYVSAEINGFRYVCESKTPAAQDGDCKEIYKNGVETEFSKNNKISDISFAFDPDVTADIWTGFVSDNGSKHTIAEISQLEFSRLGLLYSTRGAKFFTGDSDKTGTEIKNSDELVLALLEDMPLETKTALIDRLDCYIKLNDYVTIYLYKNETDGSLNDTFGISYFEGDRIHSMGSGDKFLSLVKELIGVKESPESEKQRLKFFDLAREYRFDYIPVFTDAGNLEINDIKWHIYSYLKFPEDLRGKQFNDAAYKLYGKRFEIGDDDIVMLEMGSYNKNGYMKLEEYNCVQDIDGNETVTAVLELYDYEKGYDSMPLLSQVLETVSVDDDAFIRSAIGDKSIEKYGEPAYRYIISYTSSDGYTPQRLISCIKYYNNGGEWIEVN